MTAPMAAAASDAPTALSAREDVLARVRGALVDRSRADAAPVEVPREYRRAGQAPVGDEELLDLAAERIADYRAEVRRVATDEVPAAIARALAERGAARVLAAPGLPAEWVPDGAAYDDPATPPPDLDAVDAVVTTCALTIARTGTIVLDAGPGQGRRALTLVPDYHLCVVPGDRIVQDVPDAIARLDPTRPTTFISGPSATSDIELNRVEGVHGPRTLVVLLVNNAAGSSAE